MSQSTISTLIGFVYIVIMTAMSFRYINKLSRQDKLYPSYLPIIVFLALIIPFLCGHYGKP